MQRRRSWLVNHPEWFRARSLINLFMNLEARELKVRERRQWMRENSLIKQSLSE